MPREKILPDKNELQRYVDKGLTHQQIADLVTKKTGVKVGRSAVSVALHRYGIAKNSVRYKDYLPWRLKMEHIRAYPARMLRLMGRRAAGKPMTDVDNTLLDNWLAMLDEQELIVAYDPDDPTGQGLHYIDAKHKDHDGPAPIRIKQIHMK